MPCLSLPATDAFPAPSLHNSLSLSVHVVMFYPISYLYVSWTVYSLSACSVSFTIPFAEFVSLSTDWLSGPHVSPLLLFLFVSKSFPWILDRLLCGTLPHFELNLNFFMYLHVLLHFSLRIHSLFFFLFGPTSLLLTPLFFVSSWAHVHPLEFSVSNSAEISLRYIWEYVTDWPISPWEHFLIILWR